MTDAIRIHPNMQFHRKSMDPSWEEVLLNGHMLKVFFSLNKAKTVEQIAIESDLEIPETKQALTKLLSMNLVGSVNAPRMPEMSEKNRRKVGHFLKELKRNLITAVGPMGDLLLEDALEDIGYTQSTLPLEIAPTLIRITSNDIDDPDARQSFLKAMVSALKLLEAG